MNVLKMSVLLVGFVFFYSCNQTATESVDNVEAVNIEVEETVVEEVVEEPVVEQTLAEFIKGNWSQIGQRCDAEGNNCEEMTKESLWNFGDTEVVWSKFSNPVAYTEDKILIGEGEGSPYEISSELGDTILLHAIKTDRYMKLVRVQ